MGFFSFMRLGNFYLVNATIATHNPDYLINIHDTVFKEMDRVLGLKEL